MECSRLNAKNRVQAGEENLVVNSVKSGRKIVVVVDRFYIALFSALEQTHCAGM